MNVAELLEKLEDMDPESEVRFAYQPSYPLVSEVGDVVEDYGHEHDFVLEDGTWYCLADEDCDVSSETVAPPEQSNPDEPPVVYIGEGSQIGYLDGSARNALGWGR